MARVRRPRALPIAAVLAAVGASVAGFLVIAVVVLAAWVTTAGAQPTTMSAVRSASWVWLAAHHVGFTLPTGTISLLPLGLVLVPAIALYTAGRWLAVTGEVEGLRAAFTATTTCAATYALLLAVTAVGSPAIEAAPDPWQAAAAGALLAFLTGGVGVLRGAGFAAATWRRVPLRVRAVLVAATGGTIAVVGAGALLVSLSVAMRFSETLAVWRALAPGTVGGCLLVLLSLAYLPNLALWAAAYGIGPGFAVGTSTTVALTGTQLGDLPAFPLLAALPLPGTAPGAALAATAAPVIGGAVVGLLYGRCPGVATSGERAAGGAAVAGAVAGAAVGVLAALSGGALGAARLTTVGPSGWQVGAAAAVELAVVAATAAWLVYPRRSS